MNVHVIAITFVFYLSQMMIKLLKYMPDWKTIIEMKCLKLYHPKLPLGNHSPWSLDSSANTEFWGPYGKIQLRCVDSDDFGNDCIVFGLLLRWLGYYPMYKW